MANFFAHTVLTWHKNNPRPLPWSNGLRNPYHIWLSEIIMQQTRIEQGTSYYMRFVEKYQTIADLSAASLDEVMQLWEGLGYYTRARNLHKAANHIVHQLKGKFPDSYEGLLALPGIGPYSAAAISSFAYGHHHVVVDGNVKRLISRFVGITESIDEPKTHDKIHALASDFMHGVAPDVFNQAIMNFGALVCKPTPVCEVCPLSKKCYAYKNDLVSTLPVRTKKKLKTSRYFHFIVAHHRGRILLVRRENNDIWKGLYAPLVTEFNSIRKPSEKQIDSFLSQQIGHANFEWLHSTSPVRQELSHQTIIGRFHHIKLLDGPDNIPGSHAWVTKKTIRHFGKPKMVAEMVL